MGGGGGGSSAPSNNNSGGGGGGGGGGNNNRPAPRPTPAPRPQTPPQGGTTFIDNGSGNSNSNAGQGQGQGQAAAVMGEGSATGYVGAGASTTPTGADRSVTKFIPGAGEGVEGALDTVLGEVPMTQYIGTSPFQRAGLVRGEGYLGDQLAASQEVPGLDSTVENQGNAPAVGGGDVGVGQQGFGQRALIGGEAAIVEAAGNESNAVQTAIPAETAPSDLQVDPNYQIPAPGREAIYDYNYALPMANSENVLAFVPNSREAAARARGPISRGLMSARTGFGRRFF